MVVSDSPLGSVFFFFQAEDGIRDVAVTGVQTCALPISETLKNVADARSSYELVRIKRSQLRTTAFAAWIAIIGVVALAFVSISEQRKIGRASCRERV